jgi:hypothetical protein
MHLILWIIVAVAIARTVYTLAESIKIIPFKKERPDG